MYVIVVYKLKKKKKNHTAIGTIKYKIYLCTSSDKIDFELILYMLIFRENHINTTAHSTFKPTMIIFYRTMTGSIVPLEIQSQLLAVHIYQ